MNIFFLNACLCLYASLVAFSKSQVLPTFIYLSSVLSLSFRFLNYALSVSFDTARVSMSDADLSCCLFAVLAVPVCLRSHICSTFHGTDLKKISRELSIMYDCLLGDISVLIYQILCLHFLCQPQTICDFLIPFNSRT